MPFLTMNALAGAGLMARRAWIHRIDREGLYGSDHHMLVWAKENDVRAWCMFTIAFDAEVGADWDAIQAQIVENVEQDMVREDSDFRRGVDMEAERFIFHRDICAADIIDQVDDDIAFYTVQDTERRRELVLRFHTGRAEMAVVFDHTVWDGARVVNEIVHKAIESKPFASRWLLKESYIPVGSEVLQLYTAWRMAFRRFRHTPMPPLEEGSNLMVFDHRLKLADIKAFKNREGVGFTPSLVAHWADHLFRCTGPARKKIRFGLLVACASPRHRNNYSVMLVDVHRHHTKAQTAKSVARQLKSRAIEVLPMYQLLCNVDVQSMFKQNLVDCLFSPGPFEMGTGPSQRVKTMSFFAVPSTCPIYAFACTIGEEIAISCTWNAAEISPEALGRGAAQAVEYTDKAIAVSVRR
ncbi:MAG: hypothetical protein ACON4N_16085 [Myxococcota bacterium]